MLIRSLARSFALILLSASLVSFSATSFEASGAAVSDPADWPQWGGPDRNFTVAATGLASSWPAGGPKKLWSRALGEGYSAIVAEGGRLYTMYRLRPSFWQFGKQDQEVVIALDAATGHSIWEYSYDAPLFDAMNTEYGPGPHATPLIAGDRIFTVGATGRFHALDKTTGRVLWSHDLHAEYGVLWGRGYSCSPIAYKDTVILTTGKPGRSVMAFHQSTGAVVWQKQDFDYGPSSPILITVEGSATAAPAGKAAPGKAAKAKAGTGGRATLRGAGPERQEQLVVFMSAEIAGLDPASGEQLWRHPHKTEWGLNISTPLWIGRTTSRTPESRAALRAPEEGNLLFCSSAYNSGSRMLKLTLSGGRTTVEELWFNNRMRIHIGNAVYSGGHVLGSSGDFGPSFLIAVEAKTNQEAWRDRTFSRATMVQAGGKLIILDEDGTLALATASPQGLTVHAQSQVFNGRAWTPPTLVGTRLYARDRATIIALDLS